MQPQEIGRKYISTAETEEYVLCIKDTIKNKINSTGDQLLGTDLKHLRELFHEVKSKLTGEESTSSILAVTLNEFSEIFDIKLISPEILGYLKQECFIMLESLEHIRIDHDELLRENLNKVLLKYFDQTNELDCLRLHESLIKCFDSRIFAPGTLFFIQVFTIDRLFKCQLYEKIHSLIMHFGIDSVKTIIDKDLIKNKVFNYFNQLVSACAATKAYPKSFEVANIAMSLNLESVDKFQFEQLLSTSVLATMMIVKDRPNLPVHLIKYKSKINERLYRVLQSFYSFDLVFFVCNFHLYLMDLKRKQSRFLLSIYNSETSVVLIKLLIDAKMRVFLSKLDNQLIQEEVNKINKIIEEINERFGNYGLTVPLYFLDLKSLTNNSVFDNFADNISSLIEYTDGY